MEVRRSGQRGRARDEAALLCLRASTPRLLRCEHSNVAAQLSLVARNTLQPKPAPRGWRSVSAAITVLSLSASNEGDSRRCAAHIDKRRSRSSLIDVDTQRCWVCYYKKSRAQKELDKAGPYLLLSC